MSSSKYTKTMAEAYEEVYEMDLKKGLKGFTDAIVGAGKHGLKALQAGASGIKGGAEAAEKVRTGGGTKPKNKGETEAEKLARRKAVGLSGNAGPDRAKASQEAAKPKVDAANQARKDNKAAGKVSSTLPSDYKQTELEAGRKAEASRPGAGLPRSGGGNQSQVGTSPKKTQSSDMDANYRTWAKANPGLAKKVVDKGPRQAGYKPIKDTVQGGMSSKAATSSAPKFDTKSTPAVTPKVTTPKLNTSKVTSPTPSFKAPAPKPAAAPKPMSRLDKATTGIKPMSDEFQALDDAYQSMYQLDELFPGAGEGAAAAVGGALGGPLGAVLGAGATGALTGKDKKKKAAGAGGGAAIGGALGGPVGAAIGAGVGGALGEEAEAAYQRWLEEQMTAGKSYGQPSGLDLRTTGQKMNHIKKSVQQNDKLMNKIQPPPGV